MDKKYQIFVSSTYEDLKEERLAVAMSIYHADCTPIGMELFPASPLSPWDFIKKQIDESDYYLLIVAGRYGSIEKKSGLSYTEREYDYAVSKGIPILSFLYKYIEELDTRKIDDLEKIKNFRKKVLDGNHLTRRYNSVEELIKYVKPSIENALKDYPRTGFVRADIVEKLGKNSDETLQRIQAIENELKDNYNDRKGILSQINSLAEALMNQAITSFQSNKRLREKINKISNRVETSK